MENRDDETLFFIDKSQDAIKSTMSSMEKRVIAFLSITIDSDFYDHLRIQPFIIIQIQL